MNGLSLFSGIGGLDVALSEYVRTIAYCEIEPYCQAVLLARMHDGKLAKAPIWDDVKTLSEKSLKSCVDIIYGGFPCQDISVAGAGKGLEGERSGLFYQIMRLAKEIKPKFLFLENVPAITTRGGLRVVKAIASLGYDCRWCIISASSLGALHRRKRWFLLAYANDERRNERQRRITFGLSKKLPEFTYRNFKNAFRYSLGNNSNEFWPFRSREHWQKVVCRIRRSSNGVPYQVDRLRGLGNAVVPCQAKKAFKMLMGL